MISSNSSQSAPDIAFLRNTGFVLVTLALLTGSISLAGSFMADESPVSVEPAGDLAQSTEFTLKQAQPGISRREVFQGHYINPNGVMQ